MRGISWLAAKFTVSFSRRTLLHGVSKEGSGHIIEQFWRLCCLAVSGVSIPECRLYMLSYKHRSIYDLKINNNKRKAPIASFRVVHNKHFRLLFTVVPCILILSKFLHQLMYKFLKGVLKFTLKEFQHVSVQSPSSESALFELAKITFFKTVKTFN
jgi:hypothetical protein